MVLIKHKTSLSRTPKMIQTEEEIKV